MKSRNDSEHSLSAYNGKKIIVSIIFLRMEVWIKIEEYKFVNSIICLTEKLLWALFALRWRNNCIICLKTGETIIIVWSIFKPIEYYIYNTFSPYTPTTETRILANASGQTDE